MFIWVINKSKKMIDRKLKEYKSQPLSQKPEKEETMGKLMSGESGNTSL